VPLEAVRPAFTVAPPQTPTPAAYLRGKRPWALPIDLAVGLRTPRMRQVDLPGERIARTDFRDMYWTVAQMVAHTTANGAHLRRGDLYASGTVSGTEPGTYGSLMSEVAAALLGALDGLEQRLEVADAEAGRAVALDDLVEHRRAVLDRLGEDLQQVALVVAVDEDAELLQVVPRLVDLADALCLASS
jgi:2-keto-4-pentenoate hydratase/2-oxohepta-3-ene-1,7-dioic acid hydratase in catechol pathway